MPHFDLTSLLVKLGVGFFGFVLVMLTSIVGWFCVQWLRRINDTLEANTQALMKLTTQLGLAVRDIDDHSTAIEKLWERSCNLPECPFGDTRPHHPRHARTRSTDGGADA
jgi:hypothetical protein